MRIFVNGTGKAAKTVMDVFNYLKQKENLKRNRVMLTKSICRYYEKIQKTNAIMNQRNISRGMIMETTIEAEPGSDWP